MQLSREELLDILEKNDFSKIDGEIDEILDKIHENLMKMNDELTKIRPPLFGSVDYIEINLVIGKSERFTQEDFNWKKEGF